MADNFVSEFTVNSQGTDIEVKIKDADARNLIAQEISDRDSAVTTITNNLNKEISDRESADTTITNNLNSAVTTITNNLNKEISDRESADTTITNNINKEISDRKSADTTITNKLNKEISDRTELISKDSSGNTVVTSTNGALYINTKNPIKYIAPVTLNDDFNYIPMTDTSGNEYKVLVDKGNSSTNKKFNKYVIIGDSYAAGYTPDGNVTSWSTILKNRLGNTCYANIAVGGLGLSTSITGDQNATNTVNKLTADNTVDSVIYCGGRNDANGTFYAEISQGVENFVNACHAKFPKAVVYIGFIGWDSGITEYAQARSFFLAEAISAYSNNAKNVAYTYLANSELILHDNDLMASDGKHPNEYGQITIANGIYSCLHGGTFGYHNTNTREIPAIIDNTKINIREIFNHGDDLINVQTSNRIAVNATAVTYNQILIAKNAQLRYMIPSGYGFTNIPATFDVQYNDYSYQFVPGFLRFQHDGTSKYPNLYADFKLIQDNNYVSGTINAIQIRGQGTVQLI